MNLNLDIFKIRSNNVLPTKGSLLLAEPFLKGYYFARSVVLLTEHNKDGSMGLVLNKPLDLKLSQIMKDLPFKDVNVYCGGPVCPDRLFYVHSMKNIDGAVSVANDLFFGGDFEVIKDHLAHFPELTSQIRFFIGYSGWSAGQLSDELHEDSWLVAKMDANLIIKPANEKSWNQSMSALGEKYATWSKFPSNPELN